MRYRPEHKDNTRQKIVAAAGRLFRAKGYDGVGIDDIMAAAGLTRGGFYGYFRSKLDLFARVVGVEHGFNRLMHARTGNTREELADEAIDIVSGYLDPDNIARIGRGCTMAALSADVARSSKPARRAYGEAARDLAGEFARGLDGGTELDPRALTALALCVGGITIARASDDREFSAALLTACKKEAERLLTAPPPQT